MAITINGSVSEDKVSYAYLHCRPNGTPFYVGKGTANRVTRTHARNKHYGHITDKYGRDNILIGSLECSSDAIAFELEKGLIKCFKRKGVDLANYTEGGEGFTQGNIPWNKGRAGLLSDEARAKISVAATEQMNTSESKARNSAIHSGNTYRKGSTHTPEAIEKIRLAKIGTKASDATKAKMSAIHIGNTVAKGRVWVNNGVETKMVYKDNIPSGFKLGRKV
jgi:hypothetical protein